MQAQIASVFDRVELSLDRVGLRDIQVKVSDSNDVTLTGVVASNGEKLLATAAAQTTPGVTGVANKIVVKRKQ